MNTAHLSAKDVFLSAIENHSEAEWPQYLDAACGSDQALRDKVETLLSAHVAEMSLLDAPALADDRSTGSSQQHNRFSTPKPQQIGDYRIIREIGRGGMGIVYEAEQESLGRRVAVKVLPNSMLLDQQHVHRFEREARAAAGLHHTNIVPIFGVGQQGQLHYYVMQLIYGQSLHEILRELRHDPEDYEPVNPFSPGEPEAADNDDNVPLETDEPIRHGSINCSISAVQLARSLRSGEFDQTFLVDPESLERLALSEGDYELESGEASAVGRSGETDNLRLAETQHPAFTALNSEEDLPKSDSGSLYSTLSRDTYYHRVAAMGAQVAEALEYAHGKGVIHRDIKPANLLLDVRGNVWVTDFGLAKAADQQDLTNTGDILGTLRYMAPEQFEGQSDARSDVYSLGLTLYELLSKQQAFVATDRQELIRDVTTGAPQRLRTLDPRIPLDLDTIVHKAIERDSNHRYQSAGELSADLERYLRDEPIRARRISPFTRFARWCRRNPTIAGLTTAMILLLSTVAVGSSIAAYNFEQIATEKEHALQEKSEALVEKELALGTAVIARNSAEQSEQRANLARRNMQRERDAAIHNLYVAQTKEFQQAWKSNNYGRLRSLLQNWKVTLYQRDHRDWEWTYLRDREMAGMSTIRWSPAKPIRSIDWHRESGLMVTTAERKIRISDPRKVVHEWIHDGSNIEHIRWSPDGSKLAYCSFYGEVMVWNRETKEFELKLEKQGEHLGCVAWHPDGSQLAFCIFDGTIVVWDLIENQETKRIETNHGGMTCIDWSHDGQYLAAHSHALIQVLKTDDWSQCELMRNRGKSVKVAWAPHAPVLAVSGQDASRADCIELWNAETKETSQLFPMMDRASCIQWNADGSLLAFAGLDHQLHVYDLQNEKRLNTWEVHDWPVRDIAWSPDEQQIAAVSYADHVAVARLDSSRQQGFHVLNLEEPGIELAWHPEKTILAVRANYPGNEGHLSLWDMRNRRQLWKSKTAQIRDVSWSVDGKRLLSRDFRGKIYSWDLSSGEAECIIEIGDKLSNHFYLTEHGREINLLERHSSRVTSWSLESNSLIRNVTLCEGNTYEVSPVPNSSSLGLAMQGTHARILTTNGELKHELRLHRGTLTGISASPDGTRLVTISEDGTAVIWNVETGKSIAILRGHTATVTSVDWSPSSTRIVTGSRDGTVRIWDAETGVEVLRFDPGDIVHSVAWSRDGTKIAAGDNKNHLYLWSADLNLHAQMLRTSHGLAIQEEWSKAADSFLDAGTRKLGQYESARLGGICLLKAGRHESYRKLCREELQKHLSNDDAGGPAHIVSLCGYAPGALDDYESGIDYCRSCLKQNPRDYYKIRSLGALLMRAGRYDEALNALESIPTQSDLALQSNFLIAMCYQFQGYSEAARKRFNDAEWQMQQRLTGFDDKNPAPWDFLSLYSLWKEEALVLIEPKQPLRDTRVDNTIKQKTQKPKADTVD